MKLNIADKLGITYFIVIAATLISGLFCFYTINKIKSADEAIKNHLPSIEKTKETKALMQEVKALTNSWIYLSNEKDKARLTQIMMDLLPKLLADFNEINGNTNSKNEADCFGKIKSNNEIIIQNVNIVINTIKTEDDYNNDEIVDKAIKVFEKNVQSKIKENDKLFDELLLLKGVSYKNFQSEKDHIQTMLIVVITVMILIVLLVSIVSFAYTHKGISRPLKAINNSISTAALGQNISINKTGRQDEIGQMQNELSNLIDGLNEKIKFSNEIGKENYDSHFELLSDNDELGHALINMRNNLKKSAQEDAERSWQVIGLNELATILRNNHDDQELFYTSIVNFIVKYCKANQGGLFVLNDDDDKNPVLELKACYAFEKRKFINKQIQVGDGLVGQCYIEADVIYMNDVPDGYTQITSGLGEKTASCIVLVPLIVNEKTNGVLELASFVDLKSFEIEFLKKACESISSTVTSMNIGFKTTQLLAATQNQAEEMRAQEEEMRQNMEEMKATQEEFERKELQYLAEIEKLKNGGN